MEIEDFSWGKWGDGGKTLEKQPDAVKCVFLFVLKKKSKRNECQKARKKNLFAKVEPQGWENHSSSKNPKVDCQKKIFFSEKTVLNNFWGKFWFLVHIFFPRGAVKEKDFFFFKTCSRDEKTVLKNFWKRIGFWPQKKKGFQGWTKGKKFSLLNKKKSNSVRKQYLKLL